MQHMVAKASHAYPHHATHCATVRLITAGLSPVQDGDAAKLIMSRYFAADYRRMAAIKRAFDVAASLTLLVLLSPLLGIAALVVWFDSPGPALFRQTRFGADGRVFEIWKFRTMFWDAGDPTGRARTRRGDPRVTRVGRVLRRLSIDELPQLVNVLAGEMSLVGPRPHAVDMEVDGVRYDGLFPDYHLRHLVRPGLTGWAQTHGSRGEISTRAQAYRRLSLDLHYVATFTLWLDLSIMIVTIRAVLFDKNAY